MFSCVAGKLNNAFHPHMTTKGGKKNKQTEMQMLSKLKPSNSERDSEVNPNSHVMNSLAVFLFLFFFWINN